MKKFNHYDNSEVIDRFEINKVFKTPILDSWLNQTTGVLKPAHQEIIDEARQFLSYKWDEWNEEELKMNFISMVFLVSQVDVPKRICTFYERRLSGNVNDINISLIVDCMLASPTNSGRPKSPYFFLQEFKQSLGDSHDPEGQMLAAMILSQALNNDDKPLYGCWVQGKNWNFTVLNGKDYCISNQFDATDPNDLLQIVYLLRKLKELILAR